MSIVNKIQLVKINNKYKAYYVSKNIKIKIPHNKLPYSFVRVLMKNKNANYYEIKEWLNLYYI